MFDDMQLMLVRKRHEYAHYNKHKVTQLPIYLKYIIINNIIINNYSDVVIQIELYVNLIKIV